MATLLTLVDVMLSTAFIVLSIRLWNAITPADGGDMRRKVRRWIVLHVIHHDHVLVGALVMTLYAGVAIACMAASLVLSCVVLWVAGALTSVRIMALLKDMKQCRFTY